MRVVCSLCSSVLLEVGNMQVMLGFTVNFLLRVCIFLVMEIIELSCKLQNPSVMVSM